MKKILLNALYFEISVFEFNVEIVEYRSSMSIQNIVIPAGQSILWNDRHSEIRAAFYLVMEVRSVDGFSVPRQTVI